MKFTDGYWVNKPEYDFNFATQSFSAAIDGDALAAFFVFRFLTHR